MRQCGSSRTSDAVCLIGWTVIGVSCWDRQLPDVVICVGQPFSSVCHALTVIWMFPALTTAVVGALLISLYGFSSLRLDHVYFDPYILLEGFDLCRGYSGFGATSSRRSVRSLCILLNFGYSVLIAYASALINSSRETNGSITI